MNNDINTVVRKADEKKTEVEIISNPVQKMNATGVKKNFDISQRNRVLPGTIVAARVSNGMLPHHGTFGRYSPNSPK